MLHISLNLFCLVKVWVFNPLGQFRSGLDSKNMQNWGIKTFLGGTCVLDMDFYSLPILNLFFDLLVGRHI